MPPNPENGVNKFDKNSWSVDVLGLTFSIFGETSTIPPLCQPRIFKTQIVFKNLEKIREFS